MKELILKTKKEIKSKNGVNYPKGTKCKIEPKTTANGIYYAQITILNGSNVKLNTVYKNLYRYFSKFKKEPSINTLMEDSLGCATTTPIGNRVEFDGIDTYGFPSWFMILKLI